MPERRRPKHLDAGKRELAFHVAIALALALAASAGVAWAAGFDAVRERFFHLDSVWLPVALAGLPVAYLGYLGAYRAVTAIEDGPDVGWWHGAGLVVHGFGASTPRGGFGHDLLALEGRGIPRREARIRVLGLGALEYAVLAPAAAGAAIYLLLPWSHVRLTLTLPWVIAVPLGFVGAVWAVRHREWLRRRWRIGRWIADGLDAVALLRSLLTAPAPLALGAFTGMAIYWVGDTFVLWSTLHAFLGHAPPVAPLILGYATGYALTRRTLPLAGAGAVEALLPFALLWVLLLPLAASVLGVLAYRVVNLWLALLLALLARHVLVKMEDGAGRAPA
jgi:hypothetical protein